VIVHNLHLVRIAGMPPEADPPLVVHADAVPPASVAAQLLEAITRGNPQVPDLLGRIEYQQLPQRHPTNGRSELPDTLTLEQAFRIAVAEALDHGE